jgi:hypothetical protein
MAKPTWNGGGGPIEKLGLNVGTGVIRKVPKPPHSYGSPAMDLKREAEQERRAAESGPTVPAVPAAPDDER